MNTYDRLFGAGPRGLLVSLALLLVAWRLESVVNLPEICAGNLVRWALFVLSVIGSSALAIWTLKELPPSKRGQQLVTTGAYRYLRHPIYATLLSCFNFGLAVLLNNWIYVIWALLLHGVWHWNIRGEEELMRRQFPTEYDNYCGVTGRFVPRLSAFSRRKGREGTQ